MQMIGYTVLLETKKKVFKEFTENWNNPSTIRTKGWAASKGHTIARSQEAMR